MAGRASRPLEPVVTRAMRERAEEARRLHERMGHPSDARLKQTISYGKIVNCHLTPRDVDRAKELLGECPGCLAGKRTAPQAQTSLSEPASRVGERVHVDVAFTKGKDSKIKKILIAVDEFSGYILGKELITLTKTEVHKAFDDLIDFYETRAESPIGTLVTDRE
jgi:hypothetical protein